MLSVDNTKYKNLSALLQIALDLLADLFFLIGWLIHHNGWLADLND